MEIVADEKKTLNHREEKAQQTERKGLGMQARPLDGNQSSACPSYNALSYIVLKKANEEKWDSIKVKSMIDVTHIPPTFAPL